MSFIAPNCKIPGVSTDAFAAQWLNCASENVQVDVSPLGGIGLFYDPTKDSTSAKDQDIVVLRIPAKDTYNLATCMVILDELRNTGEDDYKVLQHLLSATQPQTETLILVCYVVGLTYLINRGNLVSEKVRQVLSRHAAYLDVLKGTFTVDYPTITEGHDLVIDTLIQNAVNLKQIYEMIEKDGSIDTKFMPFKEFYQLLQAVSSRVLEVPEEVEKDGDDFYVTPTLVPVLDFANHSFTPNAYFDLDRQDSCVLLKLHQDKIPNSRFEVTINYSSARDILPFLSTYGFIPQFDTLEPEGITVHLPSTLWSPAHNWKRKWLGVPSTVEIYSKDDGTYGLKYPELLALAFDKDVHLNPKWPDYVTRILKDHYSQEDIDTFINDIKNDEKSHGVIRTGLDVGDVCGLMYGENGVVMSTEMVKQIYEGKTPKQLAHLNSACQEEIIGRTKGYVEAIDRELQVQGDSATSNPRSFDTLVYHYKKTIRDILELLLQHHR